MERYLFVIDYQNDFVDGALGFPGAEKLDAGIADKVRAYGPGRVIFVIGKNKIEKDLESAMYRARNIASPQNAMRSNLDTPCVKNGGTKCFDCNHPKRICNGFSIISRPMLGQEVEVLFVDESLGY